MNIAVECTRIYVHVINCVHCKTCEIGNKKNILKIQIQLSIIFK